MGVAILLMVLGALFYTLRFIWRKVTEKALSHKVKNKLGALEEEKLYAHVMDELDDGVLRKGLWGKALAKSNGSESQAKSKYLELRVESLKGEAQFQIKTPTIEAIPCIEEKKEEAKEEKTSIWGVIGSIWGFIEKVVFAGAFLIFLWLLFVGVMDSFS